MKELLPNKTIKSLLAVLLCLALLIALAGCKDSAVFFPTTTEITATTQRTAPEGMITVPYTSLDSLNPFYCTSLLNEGLISFLHQPLYRLSSGYNPVACLAKSHTLNELTVTVYMREDAVFSDLSSVSARDAVYSFEKAKDSVLYRESLKELAQAEAVSQYAVQFTLTKPDINVLKLLTFPIVKYGTAENAQSIPVGAGSFVFQAGDLRNTLTVSPALTENFPQIGTVRLYDVKDSSSSLLHLLDVGSIDCFYTDLSDSGSKRTYSGVNEVYLNNLVFLGFNYESYCMNSEIMRRGISFAIDRRFLAENAFVCHARATSVPMNISWDEVADSPSLKTFTGLSDITRADEELEAYQCGSKGDMVYYRFIAPDSGSFLTSAAQLIVNQLKQVNIVAELKILSEDEYKKALSEGEYDIYLGEIKLTKNMDLSPFFTAGGACVYKTDLESLTVDELWLSYCKGETDLDAFLEEFLTSMPFVPLVFRNGQFCYSRSIKGTGESVEGFLYSMAGEWEVR